MQIVGWILIGLLAPGIGDPFGCVSAAATASVPAPAEDDDSVETMNVAASSQRHRPARVPKRSLNQRGRSASQSVGHGNRHHAPRSASTAFLAAVNSPILC